MRKRVENSVRRFSRTSHAITTISMFECQRFGIVRRLNTMVNRWCESPILGMPPTARTRCFGNGNLQAVAAMKKLSPWRNTRPDRKPQNAVRLARQTPSPSVDLACARAASGAVPRLLAKTDPRYWKQKLTHRAYGELARHRAFRELSVRIEHEGFGFFFPLDTDDEEEAAVRAVQIYRTIRDEGWSVAFRRYPREFTLSLFLAENPMIFTYTTLYTATDTLPDWTPWRLRRAIVFPKFLSPSSKPKTAVGGRSPNGSAVRRNTPAARRSLPAAKRCMPYGAAP